MPTVATVAATVCRGGARLARAGRSCCAAAADKYDAFAASRAALAASGTVALELAMARLPMAVAYRLNPLTEALLDRVLKVRQVNLVNVLVDRLSSRNCSAEDCAPERLAAALASLIRDEQVRSAHLTGYDEAMRRLRRGRSCRRACGAADRILAIVAARRLGDAPHKGARRGRSREEFTMTTAAYRQVPVSAHDDPGQATSTSR